MSAALQSSAFAAFQLQFSFAVLRDAVHKPKLTPTPQTRPPAEIVGCENHTCPDHSACTVLGTMAGNVSKSVLMCECDVGYIHNVTGMAHGAAATNGSCEEIDACARDSTNNCHADAACYNSGPGERRV